MCPSCVVIRKEGTQPLSADEVDVPDHLVGRKRLVVVVTIDHLRGQLHGAKAGEKCEKKGFVALHSDRSVADPAEHAQGLARLCEAQFALKLIW